MQLTHHLHEFLGGMGGFLVAEIQDIHVERFLAPAPVNRESVRMQF